MLRELAIFVSWTWCLYDTCAVPMSGGAGNAVYMQWTLPQVISTQWISPPTGDLTIEYVSFSCALLFREPFIHAGIGCA